MTTDNLIYVGQSLELLFTVKDENEAVVDISTATLSLVIKCKGHPKVTVVPTAPNGGSDGLLRYVTLPTDLEWEGCYQAQAEVIVFGRVYPSSIVDFKVIAKL